jgi:hypothetical protein
MSRERWSLRWCEDVPEVDGESDFDNAKYRVEHFATEAEAKAAASERVTDDFFGEVEISHWLAVTAKRAQSEDNGNEDDPNVVYFDKKDGQWWEQMGRDEHYTAADLA